MVRQRAQRRDPDQEAILRGKDELNTRTTDVIKRLIDVKRKWNGNTEPKFRLTDPMPDEIVGEGGDILRELGDIMTGLRQVDQMQDEYAENRDQRISERMKQMEQVQAEVLRAELTKEASNRLTRMWSHIVAPFGSEKGKRDRLRMLRALARIDYNLRDVEDKVLSGDPAILDALYLARQLWLDAKGSFFEDYRKNLEELLWAAEKEHKRVKAEYEKVKDSKPGKTTPTSPSGTSQPLSTGPVPAPGGGEPSGTPSPEKGTPTKSTKPTASTTTTDEQREQEATNQQRVVEEEADEALRDRLKETTQIPPEGERSAHPDLGTPSSSEVQQHVSIQERDRDEKMRREIADRAVIRRRNLLSTDQLLELYLDIKNDVDRQKFLQTLTEDNRDALNREIDLIDIEDDEEDDVEEWRDLFDQFVATKKQLGEKTDLSYDDFAKYLRNRKETLMERHETEDVEFSIHVKDGRAEIIATPIMPQNEPPVAGPPALEEFVVMDYDNKLKVIDQMLDDAVPEEAIQALNLYSGEGYSLREIAEELGMIEKDEEASKEVLLKVSNMIEISQRNFIDIAKEMGFIDEDGEVIDEEQEPDEPNEPEEEPEEEEDEDEWFEEDEEEEVAPPSEPPEPSAGVPEPEPGVPEPEPDVQAPDPVEQQRALRAFIRNNINYWYTDTQDYIQTLAEIPEPWNAKLQKMWSTLNNRINRVRVSRGDAEWTRNYLMFLKAVGDIRAAVHQTQTELDAKERKPDFEFGVTMDEAQLENHARAFVKQYQQDLEKFIEDNYSSGLVSQAAHNPISRWWKRMQTHLGWSRDKSIRLMVDRHIRNARKNLQSMLDNLEKRHINFRSLIRDSEAFYESFIQVYDKLANLAEAYNSRMRIEKSDQRQQQGKMMYEIIPNSDIYALRKIADSLQRDNDNIEMLNKIESSISEMQSVINESKSQIDESDESDEGDDQ